MQKNHNLKRLLLCAIVTLTTQASLKKVDKRIAAYKDATKQQENKVISAIISTITAPDQFENFKNEIKNIHF